MITKKEMCDCICKARDKLFMCSPFCSAETEKCSMCYSLADILIPEIENYPKDGCEYCKEDNEGFRRMFGAFSITNPYHGADWLINSTKVKPRKISFCPMCGRSLHINSKK